MGRETMVGGGTVPCVRNGGGRWDGAVGRETVVFGGTAVPWVAFVFFFEKYYYITNMRKTMHGNAWFRRGRAWGKAKTMRFRFVFEKNK